MSAETRQGRQGLWSRGTGGDTRAGTTGCSTRAARVRQLCLAGKTLNVFTKRLRSSVRFSAKCDLGMQGQQQGQSSSNTCSQLSFRVPELPVSDPHCPSRERCGDPLEQALHSKVTYELENSRTKFKGRPVRAGGGKGKGDI